jgi:hypothetical protein
MGEIWQKATGQLGQIGRQVVGVAEDFGKQRRKVRLVVRHYHGCDCCV